MAVGMCLTLAQPQPYASASTVRAQKTAPARIEYAGAPHGTTLKSTRIAIRPGKQLGVYGRNTNIRGTTRLVYRLYKVLPDESVDVTHLLGKPTWGSTYFLRDEKYDNIVNRRIRADGYGGTFYLWTQCEVVHSWTAPKPDCDGTFQLTAYN
ncbi:hypothetical protein [Nonomuraea maritima]|uniref:hypothetical protein n=1 Tax=Nonomuraea maritima TaxID=683260 RepID=UPI003715475D